VWVASLLAFCTYYVTAISAVYPTAQDRLNRAASISSPGGVFLSGPGYGLGDYTVGAMFANEMTIWLMVLLAVMNILQITRTTRTEEATGRAELVRAHPVGRHAGSVAAFLLVVIADAAFAALGSVLLIAVGRLPAPDTLVLMTGLMMTSLVFAGIVTVTCQLTVHGGAATGLAMAVLGAALMIRGLGDVMEKHGSWLSWFSPLAWTQQLRAQVDLRVWPLGLSVTAIIAALALGALLASRRDLGGALLHERLGRADAGQSLVSPFALALRQQRTALLWWLVACVAVFGASGLFVGRGFSDTLDAIADQNDLTSIVFGDDPLAAFLRLMMVHNALAVAVYTIVTALGIKSEEDEGRLALSLSRPMSRTTVLLSHLAVVGLGAFLLMFLGGAVAVWFGSLVAGGTIDLGTMLDCAGAFALANAVILAFTAALYAWMPGVSPLAWALFAVVVIVTFFGKLLGLPDAVKALSPFWWVGDYPTTAIDPAHLIGLGAAALALLALAVVGFRRRDLTAG
jgi:ABC-2 type transport system permease protein